MSKPVPASRAHAITQKQERMSGINIARCRCGWFYESNSYIVTGEAAEKHLAESASPAQISDEQAVKAVYPKAEIVDDERSGKFAVSSCPWHKWDGRDYYDYISKWKDGWREGKPDIAGEYLVQSPNSHVTTLAYSPVDGWHDDERAGEYWNECVKYWQPLPAPRK